METQTIIIITLVIVGWLAVGAQYENWRLEKTLRAVARAGDDVAAGLRERIEQLETQITEAERRIGSLDRQSDYRPSRDWD
jgi:cell division protein FtsB